MLARATADGLLRQSNDILPGVPVYGFPSKRSLLATATKLGTFATNSHARQARDLLRKDPVDISWRIRLALMWLLTYQEPYRDLSYRVLLAREHGITGHAALYLRASTGQRVTVATTVTEKADDVRKAFFRQVRKTRPEHKLIFVADVSESVMQAVRDTQYIGPNHELLRAPIHPHRLAELVRSTQAS